MSNQQHRKQGENKEEQIDREQRKLRAVAWQL